MIIRPAHRGDAADIAQLSNLAGEGLPHYFWSRAAAPGQEPWDYGVQRIMRDEGGMIWRNSVVAQLEGRVAGVMVTYRIGREAIPPQEIPAIFRPLQHLENAVPGHQYVLALATYPDYRRRGIARRLLDDAHARGASAPGTCLIVADGNRAAIALYESCGYAERARQPIIFDDWHCNSTEWILMVRG